MTELNDAGATYRLVGYPNAVHAFTNPAAGSDNSKGAAYNKDVADAAFGEMEAFFSEVLRR